MDLEVEMSSLSISHKKRRLSGVIPGGQRPCADYESSEEATSNDTPQSSTDSPTLPDDTVSISPTLELEENDIGATATSSDSTKEANVVAPRRSARLVSNGECSASTSSATFITQFDVDKDFKLLKKIYTDKRIRRTCPSLETIFETPTDDKKVMSGRKFKRYISFQELHKNKVRKRPLKAKGLNPKNRKKKRVTMDALMQKLNGLDSDND